MSCVRNSESRRKALNTESIIFIMQKKREKTDQYKIWFITNYSSINDNTDGVTIKKQ